MELTKILEGFNLNRKEAYLYLTALELGTASAKDIASKAGLQRTHFYDISQKLLGQGLLQQVKKGQKRFFQALEPEGLIKLQEKRLEELREALPRFKALNNTKGQKAKVYYYEGANGVKQVYEQMLLHKGEILLFTTPSFVSAERLDLLKEHVPQRVARGNGLRMIGEVSPENQMLQTRDQAELRETRLLPKSLYHSNIELGMYGNRIYLVDYQELFGLIIEATEISNTLKMIFEIVWNSGKIVSIKTSGSSRRASDA